MSLYNMVFGENPNIDILLTILDINKEDIPRLRDVFVEDNKIVIYTRTGGGNREFYENLNKCKKNYPDYFDGSADEPSGPWNDDLRKNSLYLYDEDCDFDSTYAYFYFEIPENIKNFVKEPEHQLSPSKKWDKLFESLQEK